MEQWINLNWNKRSVLAHQYSVLGENWPYPPITSGSYGGEGGREGGRKAGRRNVNGF